MKAIVLFAVSLFATTVNASEAEQVVTSAPPPVMEFHGQFRTILGITNMQRRQE